MLAFDCSNWTGEISFGQVLGARAAGFTRAIVNIIDPPRAYPASTWRSQVTSLLALGVEVEAYVYLYLRGDAPGQVKWVCDNLRPLEGKVRRLWLDIEDVEDSSLTTEQRVAAVRLSVEAAQREGYEVGIYTGAWWWNAYMPGVTEFSVLPLWPAYWDAQQTLDFVPFGGWNQAVMKQYAGTSTIPTDQGTIKNVDLSFYEN